MRTDGKIPSIKGPKPRLFTWKCPECSRHQQCQQSVRHPTRCPTYSYRPAIYMMFARRDYFLGYDAMQSIKSSLMFRKNILLHFSGSNLCYASNEQETSSKPTAAHIFSVASSVHLRHWRWRQDAPTVAYTGLHGLTSMKIRRTLHSHRWENLTSGKIFALFTAQCTHRTGRSGLCMGSGRPESRSHHRLPWQRFSYLFRIPPGKCRDSTLFRPRPLPSKSFTNHQSSYQPMIYSLFSILNPSLNN
jgi:hypothetical protein